MGLLDKLGRGLAKTRAKLKDSLADIVSGSGGSRTEILEELEEFLLLADVGPSATEKLLDDLRQTKPAPDQLAHSLKAGLQELLQAGDVARESKIIVLVGVNGSGKTTTVGKLCHRFKNENKTPFVIGCDTFRAAADRQLEAWCQRTNTECIIGKPKSDPASVIYDGLNSGQAQKADVIICDTAGRLHVNKNLMRELEKIVRVARKIGEENVEVLMTIDAGTGQAAIDQFAVFHEWIKPDGIILTKLDGTAKGGIAVALVQKYQVPVRYLGVGETLDDLLAFSSGEYVDALIPETVND